MNFSQDGGGQLQRPEAEVGPFKIAFVPLEMAGSSLNSPNNKTAQFNKIRRAIEVFNHPFYCDYSLPGLPVEREQSGGLLNCGSARQWFLWDIGSAPA